MGTETGGANVSRLGKRLICAKCVTNQYLIQKLSKVGKNGDCSYCHGESMTLTVKKVAVLIRIALEKHYKRVVKATEESSVSESVGDIIMGLTGAKVDLANDLQSFLMQGYRDKSRSKNPFDNDALYKLDASLLFSWEEQWTELKNHILNESRFFNRNVEKKLKLMIDGISKLTSSKGTSFINEYDEGQLKIFRARVFQSSEKLKDALCKPVQKLGPPPSRLAKDGRLNSRGIAAFYGATDSVLAIAEVRPPISSEVVVAAFKNVRQLRLLDIEALRDIVRTSLLDPSYKEKAPIEEFLANLGDMISAPVMPDDEPFDYLITQAVADYLSERGKLNLDGILYRSTQMKVKKGKEKVDKEKRNVFLFYKSSLVESRDDSEVIEVNEELDDKNKKNYILVISKDDKICYGKKSNIRNDSNTKYIDTRKKSLCLDISEMFVRNIDGVKFTGRRKKIVCKKKSKSL